MRRHNSWFQMPFVRLIFHCTDVTMSVLASQITGIFTVCSTVWSGKHQRKHESSSLLAFVRGIYQWPVTMGQLQGKCFHLMTSSCKYDPTLKNRTELPHSNRTQAGVLADDELHEEERNASDEEEEEVRNQEGSWKSERLSIRTAVLIHVWPFHVNNLKQNKKIIYHWFTH